MHQAKKPIEDAQQFYPTRVEVRQEKTEADAVVSIGMVLALTKSCLLFFLTLLLLVNRYNPAVACRHPRLERPNILERPKLPNSGESLLAIFMLILGLVVLSIGAELLVRGASRLAFAVGISPLVVGLTVVAFGTSAPELVVSVQSAMQGQSDVAIGNVVGSNILNVLLILGISAAITPLTVSQQLIRLDVPLMIAMSIAMLVLALDGAIGFFDGCLLFSGLVAYNIWAVVKSRREQAAIRSEYEAEFGNVPEQEIRPVRAILLNTGLLIAGLLMLVGGARWFLDSAITIARLMGVSELVIGLTIVAAGTSLPEVAASIMAAIRGERDIAVGNVVGSNLFNIMGVLGISSLVSKDGIAVSSAALSIDIPIMIAVAVSCLPIFFTGHRIARWEGALFLGYYVAYTVSLAISKSHPEHARTLTTAIVYFVMPLTVITLIIGVIRSLKSPVLQAGPQESNSSAA